jgi:hypothetical protein
VPRFSLACRTSRGDLAGIWINPPQRFFPRWIAKKIKYRHSILLTGILDSRSITDALPEQQWVINRTAIARIFSAWASRLTPRSA